MCDHPLVPVANKPLLMYGCEALQQAGISEVGIVSSSETAGELREALADDAGCGLNLTYVNGEQPRDLAEAIGFAEGFLEGERFVSFPAYGLLRQAIRPFADTLVRDDLDALLLFQRPDSPRADGIVDLNGGRSASLARRLLTSSGSASLVDIAVFGPRIFAALHGSGDSAGERYDTADAIERLLADDGRVQGQIVDEWWEHHGTAAELLEANRMVLDEVTNDYADATLVDSRIQGRATVHPSARLESTMVRGPVAIGAGARVTDSYIGPYTAIGENAVIEGAEIEHSIILPGAVIKHLGRRLEASVVGRGAKVMRDFALPRALRVQVGDGAEISLT